MNKGGEGSDDISTFARRYAQGDNHAMLRKVFEAILDDSTPTQSREEQLTCFMHITSICRAFFKSSFFQDGCHLYFSGAKKSLFFRQTARRPWRIQIYYSGALIFAATWMKHCWGIFNLGEPSFSGVCVENMRPKVVDFPSSVWETLAGILRWRMVKFSEEDLDLCFDGNSMPFVDLAWCKEIP